MSEPESIGVVGLGLLGGAIAARLAEQGREVVGFDLSAERREAAVAAGATVVDASAAVFERCDTVVTCLPEGRAVGELLSNVAGVLRSGQVIVDSTTAAPEEMVSHTEFLRGHGVSHVEAEVAGSSVQLRRGEAMIFAAGEAETFERVRGLLERAIELGHSESDNTAIVAAYECV